MNRCLTDAFTAGSLLVQHPQLRDGGKVGNVVGLHDANANSSCKVAHKREQGDPLQGGRNDMLLVQLSILEEQDLRAALMLVRRSRA